MGHQQDHRTVCGRQMPNPSDPNSTITCSGTKSTIYEYDDNGNCTSQTMWPCNMCGNG